jgi:hypothetical protein
METTKEVVAVEVSEVAELSVLELDMVGGGVLCTNL